jgi:integrase
MALSKMAVGIIREALTDEGQQFVFESDDNKGQPRGRQIMNDALNGKRGRGGPGILKLMGIDADDAFKPHDFRHTAGTFLVDVLGFMLSDVSLALGHTFKGERVAAVRQAPTVTRGYVHSHYLIQKRRIMEAWADELTRIIGGNVIRLAA